MDHMILKSEDFCVLNSIGATSENNVFVKVSVYNEVSRGLCRNSSG